MPGGITTRPLVKGYSTFLERLPQLDSLHLTGDACFSLHQNSAPWARLRTCTFDQCRLGEILDVLPLFANGSTLIFEFMTRRGLDARHPCTTNIGSLALKWCDGDFTQVLLKSIQAPHLTKISIGPEPEYYDPDESGFSLFTELSDLVVRSRCRLTHLVFSVGDWKAAPVIDALAGFLALSSAASIIELDVRAPALGAEVIGMLATRSGLLPRLRVLGVSCWTAFTHRIRDDSLRALHAAKPALEMLWIETPRSMPGITQKTVDNLRADGLRVLIFQRARHAHEYEF
ncbi:hypothetical protein MKEN_00231200 [Mycena kentingensis (nom. inval.)]|nr:hypothetical protein MKEN_00231200 [Mycena kentingensis (nom. inval.)]